MRMLYKLIKALIKLLIILLVIAECLTTLEHNSLSSTVSSFSRQQIPLSLKAGNIGRTNLRHTKRMFVAINDEDGKNSKNRENEEIVREYGTGRISRQGPKVWDQWGNWSSCSVTCGIGKLTRWRHCIDGSCVVGEKKAQLKTCTLAAC